VTDIRALTWSTKRASDAIEAVAHAARLPVTARAPLPSKIEIAIDDDDLIGPWVDDCAARLGLESEPIRATNGEIASLVHSAGPAILLVRLPEPALIALVGVKRGHALVAAPDRGIVSVDPSVIEDALWAPIEARNGPRADAILERADVDPKRRLRARVALLREPVAGDAVQAGWILRLPPSASFRKQASRAALFQLGGFMLAATIAAHILSMVAWWLIGQGALGGSLDRGMMIAWALLLFTMIPLRVVSSRWQGLLMLTLSGLLKQRLLAGALRLDPEELRGQGTGQILGRVIESEAVESLVLGGGFSSVLAVIELAIAAPVLAVSAGGPVALAALAVWTVLAVSLTLRYARRSHEWADSRVKMTNDLVERMVGHRTRIAQESPDSWHDEEDRALADYLDKSARLDFTSTLLSGFLGRGWTIFGLLSLVPGFLVHSASSGAIAAGVGGVLLARGAFGRLAGGMASLAGAHVAWTQVAPIFRAAARPEELGTSIAEMVDVRKRRDDEPLLVAHDVAFRYRPQGDDVLKRVSLQVESRDRLLLEGPSGGGKSTLGSLMTGLRSPGSGLLLLDGLDRHTLGSRGWRKRVAGSPQFHENHVLSNTFLFNVLMGRRWPPQPDDVDEAMEVCRELGLGPLLDRMPAGFAQMVGETGWQLSHGEKSRLFIARALLQNARLIVLDESFAALDPETLALSLRCVLARARALVVIAHP
jgi:ATP-binding cassette subfamily B protein